MSTSDIFKKKYDSEEIFESELKIKKSWLKLEKSNVTDRDISVKDKKINVIKPDKIKMKSSKNMRIEVIMTWQHKHNI